MSNTNQAKAVLSTTITSDANAQISVVPKELQITPEQLNQVKDVFAGAPWLKEVAALANLSTNQLDDLVQHTIVNFGEITRLVWQGVTSGDKESAGAEFLKLFEGKLPPVTFEEFKVNLTNNIMLLIPKLHDWVKNTFGEEQAKDFTDAFIEMKATTEKMKVQGKTTQDIMTVIAVELTNKFKASQMPVSLIAPSPSTQRTPTLNRSNACNVRVTPITKPVPSTEQLILSAADIMAEDVVIGSCFKH